MGRYLKIASVDRKNAIFRPVPHGPVVVRMLVDASRKLKRMDAMAAEHCELCRPENILLEGPLAYVRYDNNSLSLGHVLVDIIPSTPPGLARTSLDSGLTWGATAAPVTPQ